MTRSTPEATAEDLPLALAAPATQAAPPVAVMPVVLLASLLTHVAAYLVIAALPASAFGMDRPREIEIEIFELNEPVEPEPEPEVIPEPEPVAVTPPTPRERPEPRVEPPPPPLVLTGNEATQSDMTAPLGEEGGVPNGIPGGTGEGPLVEAPAPVAIAPGPPGLSRRELRARLLTYIRETLSSFVNAHLDYPLAASRANAEGVVMLRLRLAADGRILGVRLSSTSGHDILDRAALSRVTGLGSMPAPPRDIPWDDTLELPLPVTYRLP